MIKRFSKSGLIGILGLELGLASSLDSFGKDERTEAERFLDSFPNKIKGAAKVDKFHVRGAKTCLVHIGDWHYGSYGGIPPYKDSKGYKVCSDTQEDVYNIINSLVDLGITEFGSEGAVCDDFARDIIINEGRGILKQDIENYSKRKYPLDAKDRATLTRGIHTWGTEDGEALANAHRKIREKVNIEEYVSYVLDKREDEVLRITSERGKPYGVIIYGGGHCFGGTNLCGNKYREEMKSCPDPITQNTLKFNVDNISEWNRKNPDRMISLIEIMPDAVKILFDSLKK